MQNQPRGKLVHLLVNFQCLVAFIIMVLVSKIFLCSQPTTSPPTHCPLILLYKPFLLDFYQHSHTSTHLHLHFPLSPPCSSRFGYTHCLKNYTEHFTYRQLQNCLAPPIYRENSSTSYFQPSIIFAFQKITSWIRTSQVLKVAIQLRLPCCRSLKLCELRKLNSNHLFSICLIYLLHFTLSIIRSSIPPLISGHHSNSTSLFWMR